MLPIPRCALMVWWLMQYLPCVVSTGHRSHHFRRQASEASISNGTEINGTSVLNTFASIVPAETLEWVPCYTSSPAAKFGSLECARLIAPLDYTGETPGNVQLGIIRFRPSAKGSACNKTVFVNPGGPGQNSVDFVQLFAGEIQKVVGTDHDIVGIAPRGVGPTFPPVSCYENDQVRLARLPEVAGENTQYSNAALRRIDAWNVGYAIDCSLVGAELLPHMGTVNTAKDMDFVMKALGQDRLSYFGVSYGTVLGVTYATLFPERVERMILDGVGDANDWYAGNPSIPEITLADRDAALESFFRFCDEAGPEKCAFWSPGGPEAIEARLFDADRRIRETPLNIPQGRLIEFPWWQDVVESSLVAPQRSFALLAEVAAEIFNSTPGAAVIRQLQQPGDPFATTEPPLTDAATGRSNTIAESLFLISCLDRAPPQSNSSIEDLQRLVDSNHAVSQWGDPTVDLRCLRFPFTAKERITTRIENIKTHSPILFVGQMADTRTPLRNAIAMSEAFPGSSLLTINGTGHTVFNTLQGPECFTQHLLPYFVNGTLPPPGTVCQANQRPFDQ